MPTISSEGQIFIPKSVRDVLSIFPGDEVDFRISGNQVFLCKKKSLSQMRFMRQLL